MIFLLGICLTYLTVGFTDGQGHLWKKETDNKYCEFHDELIFDVTGQRGCQTKCESNEGCVGITYSHEPHKKQICYVCLFDDLSPITGGFAFYRRPVDCEWHEFGDWSACTNRQNPCQESGRKKRFRTKKIIEKYGGKSCEGSPQQTEVCDETCPALKTKVKTTVADMLENDEDVKNKLKAWLEDNLKGLKGDKGEDGKKGDRGDNGNKGDRGDNGNKGGRGDNGNKGDRGSTGLKGNRGIQGHTGSKGMKGVQGLKGVKGDTGFQGMPGIKGERGYRGSPGVKGSSGSRGQKGESCPYGYAYRANVYCLGSFIEDYISDQSSAINKCNALDNCYCVQHSKSSNTWGIKQATDWRSSTDHECWEKI